MLHYLIPGLWCTFFLIHSPQMIIVLTVGIGNCILDLNYPLGRPRWALRGHVSVVIFNKERLLLIIKGILNGVSVWISVTYAKIK